MTIMFLRRGTLSLTYKSILVAYCLLFFGLISPFLLLGEVVAPNRQSTEIGAIESNIGNKYIENRKFSDYTNAYIPEISQNLKGARSNWLTVWTNQNEFGRPTYHISGFSTAYLPSWAISQITDSPWRFITILSLITCFLGGFFVILFCREIGLTPMAGLIAGSSLATSPLFMYWLTFPMFPAIWCWAAGALWAVTRMARKSDLLGWSVLAFSAYSLLMTAYPQPVVFHAYLLASFGLVLAYRKRQLGWPEVGRFIALSVSALIAGAAVAAPVYIDLLRLAAESARAAPDPSFFTVVLPNINTFTEALRFFVVGTIPELFGNPVEESYPFLYNGLSVTPLVVFFAVIGLLTSLRQTWGWWLAIVVLCLLAFYHPLYVLGVKYLGFNLSRSTPLGSIMLPLTVIVAYGTDSLVKRTNPGELSLVVLAAAACLLAVIAVGLGFGQSQGIAIRRGMVLVILVLLVLLAAQYKKTRPVLLIAALAIVLATILFPLMLRQDPAQIARASPLVEAVRAGLPAGSRFAVAAPGLSVLPANLNATFGLASAHSYNSLSSKHYHTLVNALGGEVHTYGRSNNTISPDYNGAMFWMSNIGLMLSPTKLVHENLEYLGEASGVHLHKVISRMGDSLQISSPTHRPETVDNDGVQVADPRLMTKHAPSKRTDSGDLLEFEVKQGLPSVLVLSQKYHRDWQAQVLGASGWTPAKTTVINGVFQGVFLPQDTQRVRLEFKPYARYAWIAHVFWLLLLALLGFKGWQRKGNSVGSGVPAG